MLLPFLCRAVVGMNSVKCYFPRWMFCTLRQYFPKCVGSAPCACLLFFLDIVLSRYVARVFPELFWDASSGLYYYWYHFCFYILHAVYLYCNVLYFIIFSDSFLITFQSPEMAAFINKLVHYYYYYYYYYWLLLLLLLWPLYFTYFPCSQTVCSECVLVCEVLALCRLHLLRILTYLYIAHYFTYRLYRHTLRLF